MGAGAQIIRRLGHEIQAASLDRLNTLFPRSSWHSWVRLVPQNEVTLGRKPMKPLRSRPIVRWVLGCRHAVLVLLLLAICPGIYAQTQSSQKPLSKDDVVKLLTGNVSSKRVGALARERGIDFQVTPETEKELSSAGADDALIAVLRELAPKPPILVVTTTPGDAQVFVDDELIARTSAEGRLKISSLTPGPHKLRVSLEGYRDHEEGVVLVVGGTLDLPVALEVVTHSSTLSAQATNGHTEASASAKVFRVVKAGGSGGHYGILRISDRVQYQSDDGKQDFEIGLNDIAETKKQFGPLIWTIRLTNGKTYTFKSTDARSREAALSAIRSAMVHN